MFSWSILYSSFLTKCPDDLYGGAGGGEADLADHLRADRRDDSSQQGPFGEPVPTKLQHM